MTGQYNIFVVSYHINALMLLVRRQKGYLERKKQGVGLLVVTIFDWRFARLIAPVVTIISIILCSNKMAIK